MTVAGERANLWEKNTWPILENLARFHPEAGVHFQQLKLFVREKDVGTAKASRWVGLESIAAVQADIDDQVHRSARQPPVVTAEGGSQT